MIHSLLTNNTFTKQRSRMSVKGFYLKGIKGLALLDGKSSAGLRHSDVMSGSGKRGFGCTECASLTVFIV